MRTSPDTPKQGIKKSISSTLETLVDETEDRVEGMSDRMEQMADEARLQAHLGMMELAERWERLQTEIAHNEDDLRNAERRMADRMQKLEMKLKGIEEKGEAKTKEALTRIGAACAALGRKFDRPH